MGDVEVAMEEILEMLPGLIEQDLEEVVTGLTLDVKSTKGKGSRKSLLLNTIRRYITSEEVEDEEDQGLEMMGKLHTDIETRLNKMKDDLKEEKTKASEIEEVTKMEEKLAKMKEEIAGYSGSDSSLLNEAMQLLKSKENWNKEGDEANISRDILLKVNDSKSKGGTPELLPAGGLRSGGVGGRVDMHKFKIKEFKINGTIGGDSEIEFSSLIYQVKEGRKLGYSEEEIQLGIVKVVKDKTLKKFFEINTELSSEDFYGMLRNHYDVEDSTTLLEEMSTSVQEPTENIVKFVMRMMNYRNTILQVTAAEDCPLGEPIIQKQFVRSVLVGLRKPTNRLELQPLFGNRNTTDLQILKEVKEIMKKDKENEKKMGKKGDVSTLDVDLDKLAERKKEGKVIEEAVLEQISNLTAQVQGLLNAVELLKDELREIKRSGGVTFSDQQRGGDPSFKFKKCKDCEKNRKYCTHCSICGSKDHKRKDCEKNE